MNGNNLQCDIGKAEIRNQMKDYSNAEKRKRLSA